MIKDLRIKNKNHPPAAKAAWWTTPKATQFGGQARGFSLIEIVVVVGSFSMIVVGVISTILLTFRSQNKVKTNNKTSENAQIVLTELRRNIFNSDSTLINCGALGVGSSVTLRNRNNLGVTSIVCGGNNIASNSAILNSKEVVVYNCQNFAKCITKPGSSEVASVEFNFGLRAITGGVGSSEVFSTTVTTRN